MDRCGRRRFLWLGLQLWRRWGREWGGEVEKKRKNTHHNLVSAMYEIIRQAIQSYMCLPRQRLNRPSPLDGGKRASQRHITRYAQGAYLAGISGYLGSGSGLCMSGRPLLRR